MTKELDNHNSSHHIAIPIMSQFDKIQTDKTFTWAVHKAPVTLDRIEPPNVKRMRILVIRWQKGQSGRKTETTDVHAPGMERLKRTGNEYVTHGFSSTSQMFPNEWRTTNEHVPDNQNAYRMHNGQTEHRTDINGRVQDSATFLYALGL